ncbi:MAG: hypothetical protein HYY16_13925, partial [Planctomycetes bacterium]|nr:hypothetical protein [Planctomycetota bacterium]
MKLLVPVAVAVLGLVLLGFIVSVPVAPPPHEMTEIMLEEGESRMVSVPFEPTAPPLELKAGKPEVIDHTIFPMKDSEGLLFVLVTGVGSGSTNWSVVMADGRVRTFRTQVVAVQPRTPAADDRALAVKKIEDGDLFLKEAERELGNPYKAVVSYREACEILG